MRKFKWLSGLSAILLSLCAKTGFGNPIVFTPLDITMPEMTVVRATILGFANYGLDLLVLLFVLDWFGVLVEVPMKEVLKYNLWVTAGGWVADLVAYWLVESVGISGLWAGFRFVVATSIFAGALILFWNFFLARWLLNFDLDEAFKVGVIFSVFTNPWSLAVVFLTGALSFTLLVALTAYKLCKTLRPRDKFLLLSSRLAIVISVFIYWFVIMALSHWGEEWISIPHFSTEP
jgi:hypothetical protein